MEPVMQELTTPHRYDRVARSLHWLTMLLIVAQFVVAWTMPDIHRGVPPLGLIAWHLSIGTVLLAVTLVRAIWRLSHREPMPPSTLPPVIQLVSRATHFMLYALLVALPLLGWANASARGWSVTLFGILPLPPLSHLGSPTGQALGDVHQTVAIALLVVIGLHVLGALYHLIVVQDDTVQRMI